MRLGWKSKHAFIERSSLIEDSSLPYRHTTLLPHYLNTDCTIYTHHGCCFWLGPAAFVSLFLVSGHKAHIHLLLPFNIHIFYFSLLPHPFGHLLPFLFDLLIDPRILYRSSLFRVNTGRTLCLSNHFTRSGHLARMPFLPLSFGPLLFLLFFLFIVFGPRLLCSV